MPSLVLDSAGKIPHAILEGKLHWIGAYDQCMDVRDVYNSSDGEQEFNGQSARLDVTLKQLVSFTYCIIE